MYAVEVGEAVFDLFGPLSSLPLVTFRAKSDTFSPRFRCGTLAVRQFTRALSLRRSPRPAFPKRTAAKLGERDIKAATGCSIYRGGAGPTAIPSAPELGQPTRPKSRRVHEQGSSYECRTADCVPNVPHFGPDIEI